mmetsp:Transcript_9238/g.19951  ORF Transcript_9238/g.19951 Transcript_9238/m.19951 type:complete len:251 (+) Transcript_9238:69-821(+)
MSSAEPTPSADGNENVATGEQKGDFFSMFYLPTSQSYDEDVHLTTSSYSAPFQGAATAVMGGILSVIDTALTVLNEEFDNPSDSIISESTKDDGEDAFEGNGDSCATSKSVLGCCKKTAHSSLSPSSGKVEVSSTNQNKASDNSVQSAKHGQNARNSSNEQSDSPEKEYFSPQNSLIGTISTLQLYDEDTGDIMESLISDLNSKSMNDMEIERNTDAGPELEISKKEDSEYCIIRNESETNDGWLVVCDD